MTTKRLLASAVLATLLLGLGACSSSSKETATTSAPTTTTTTVARVKGKLGPCPRIFPRVVLPKLNEGVKSLDEKLVPFEAQSVRVCTYNSKARLDASGKLIGADATKLEADTNALEKSATPITCENQKITRLFFLTFDSTTQRVHLGESDACGGGISNGTLVVVEKKPWATQVIAAATKKESA